MIQRAVIRDRSQRLENIDTFKGVLAKRLDFLKQGAAWRNNGNLSSVSPELKQLVEKLTAEKDNQPTEESKFDSSTLEKLDTTSWNGEQLTELLEATLSEWGLLSEYKATWQEIEDRDGYAPDEKWQVAVHRERSSFLAAAEKRVLWVPGDFDRTLTQLAPAGVLPLVAHELKHFLQDFYNLESAQHLPVAKISGKKLWALQEAGAVYEERRMQNAFGRQRPVNPHYLAALEAKLAGGNKLQVIRAYYNSRATGKQMDDKEVKKARKTAVGAALRLYRHSGYNSQPLDYIEQELISQELRKVSDDAVEIITTAATAFSIKESAELHKFGLLELPDNISFSVADEVTRIFKEKFLPQIT